jgi:glutamate-ammonia-ligase adenylyltransferase
MISMLEESLTELMSASRFLRDQLQIRRVLDNGLPGHAAHQCCSGLMSEPWNAIRLDRVFCQHLGQAASSGLAPIAACGRALRRTRADLMVGLLLRDAHGLASLSEVTEAMTALADLAVNRSLQVLAPALVADFQREGRPFAGANLMVLSMGKGGSGELNVSSDLDLIFVYDQVPDPDGLVRRFCDRLGQALIRLLADRDGDGFVFRVDMRLRPHGDSGPLCVSLGMLEEYLVREGREWERFAWGKARVVSLPVLGAESEYANAVASLNDLIRAFVYRRYLDLGAVTAIADMHARILDETRRRQRHATVFNVKLGRGGIREIEFFAQTFCIMRGGRDARLRVRGTQESLRVLAAIGLISAEESQRLLHHYRFLRRLEHALQFRQDEQTHDLPEDPLVRAQAATLMGISPIMLDQQLTQTVVEVSAFFDRLLASADRGDSSATKRLTDDINPWQLAGFSEPGATMTRVSQWLQLPKWDAASLQTRQRLQRLLDRCLAWLQAGQQNGLSAADADAVLQRWMQLMDVIARRGSYLSLLLTYPQAHDRVMRLLGSGGWPSQYLSLHPVLLDELIQPIAGDFPGLSTAPSIPAKPGWADDCWAFWKQTVAAQLQASLGDVERQLNILRDAYHGQIFQLLLADQDGRVSIEVLADHLSALADATVDLALRFSWLALASPEEPMPPLGVVAYGKLGGRELGYASDLDLAFIYAADPDPEIMAGHAKRCTQWAQRLVTWLSATTSSGSLFDIDLRLRPNGDAGLLVVPMPAFERYHLNDDGRGAWLWETQALTRARLCAGHAGLASQFNDLRQRVLSRRRDTVSVCVEVDAMRQRMADSHRHGDGLFDLKHDRGGMIDLEFAVQALVLCHGAVHPELLDNLGNLALLQRAGDLGLISRGAALAGAAAYRDYRQRQHAARLSGHGQVRYPPSALQGSADAVLTLWRLAVQLPGRISPDDDQAQTAGSG